MFSPNVINGVLQSRFDEITTHLNHQLSFSPLSNKGHVLVDDNFYDFEVDNEGHMYSPQQLEGYDFYEGKSYLGHYNDMNFSPGASGGDDVFEDNHISFGVVSSGPYKSFQSLTILDNCEAKIICKKWKTGKFDNNNEWINIYDEIDLGTHHVNNGDVIDLKNTFSKEHILFIGDNEIFSATMSDKYSISFNKKVKYIKNKLSSFVDH